MGGFHARKGLMFPILSAGRAGVMTRPMRLFLVEDNAADAWLIEECLRRRSIPSAVERHSTAEAAVRALRLFDDASPAPDLMLIDFNLPCGHGLSVLEAASRNRWLDAVPKAVISSLLSAKERDRAQALGVRRVVQKPLSLDEFLEEVGGAIEDLLELA
jgi:CheY-like chemotaxis protein